MFVIAAHKLESDDAIDFEIPGLVDGPHPTAPEELKKLIAVPACNRKHTGLTGRGLTADSRAASQNPDATVIINARSSDEVHGRAYVPVVTLIGVGRFERRRCRDTGSLTIEGLELYFMCGTWRCCLVLGRAL
jgi:hypothetical protein